MPSREALQGGGRARRGGEAWSGVVCCTRPHAAASQWCRLCSWLSRGRLSSSLLARPAFDTCALVRRLVEGKQFAAALRFAREFQLRREFPTTTLLHAMIAQKRRAGGGGGCARWTFVSRRTMMKSLSGQEILMLLGIMISLLNV